MAKKNSNKSEFVTTGDADKDFEKLMDQLGAMPVKGSAKDVNVICSTGSIALNKALGVGGYPEGRVIEIYGQESSGKTTLTLHAIAEAQKEGHLALFVDAEHALDPLYAETLGVDTERLMIIQPDSGEAALNAVQDAVETGQFGIIVVDSVAALTPRAEIEGEIGDSHVGLQARMMSQALRKLTSAINKNSTTVFFINQIRMKIGVMFGNPETTSGGNALKFYSSIRLEIRKSTAIKNGDNLIGQLSKVKVVKNKVAPPFKVAEFDIMYGLGIDHHSEILQLAVAEGVVEKSGAWYSYNKERLGQGKDKTVESLKVNEELFSERKEAIIEKVGDTEAEILGLKIKERK